MELHHIDLDKTNAFSPIFLNYVQGNEKLKPFFNRFPLLENFEAQITEKKQKFPLERRKTLKNVLERQYKKYETPLKKGIENLENENTFLVTTGHQLSFFTGPLFFIYKIITVINTAKILEQKYPSYKFCPVYWMHTEDHDFEEINNFSLFAKKYVWESQETGPVGWFSTKTTSKIFEELPEKIPFFEEAYSNSENLTEATFKLVNHLFKNTELICLDPSAPELKASFSEVIWEDFIENKAAKAVLAKSEELASLAYKIQVNPREINFFYMEKGIRERFIEENDKFSVKGTNLKFSKEELKKLLEEKPEKFSPNVVMRPLYQEWILPNVAYIGGPGELAYWLQLKGVFEEFQEIFPILMPRNFALVINKTNAKKLQKLNRNIEELFLEEYQLKDKYIKENTEQELSLKKSAQELESIFQDIAQNAQAIDKSLEAWVKAEGQKAQKIIENIEKRLKKREEQNMETEIKQLIALKNRLFPNGSLQERNENILSFLINQPNFIQELQEKLIPFRYQMHILIENVL